MPDATQTQTHLARRPVLEEVERAIDGDDVRVADGGGVDQGPRVIEHVVADQLAGQEDRYSHQQQLFRCASLSLVPVPLYSHAQPRIIPHRPSLDSSRHLVVAGTIRTSSTHIYILPVYLPTSPSLSSQVTM